ncbi:MAG: hypothetical protein JWL61_2861 [Gemmatimonadetes bacterium]|nr:hypothetical protein [Gemmatimonadota bacterium]
MEHPESLSYELSPRLPGAEEREVIAQELSLHFAADHLSMDELEERLSLVYGAPTSAQLHGLVADLPALDRRKLDSGNSPMLAPSALVPNRGVVIAFMGGAERTGSWLVPRELKVWAALGGALIDLRDAKFAPGITEIDVTAFMGGVEIIIPRGVRVETIGAAVMGGFGSNAGDATALDPAQPVLRVTGLAIMGGVEVKVQKPGKRTLKKFEAAMDAVRRYLP